MLNFMICNWKDYCYYPNIDNVRMVLSKNMEENLKVVDKQQEINEFFLDSTRVIQ